MNHQILDKSNQEELIDLFRSVFTSSEGAEEGGLIGNLVSELSSGIDNEEIICIASYEEGVIIGAIFFTRLRFNLGMRIYMLAPVAVSTEYQTKGVGQALINYGLKELQNRSVEISVTYGDPAFYGKLGFQSLSEDRIKAPLKLSMPEGWLGKSLIEKPIPAINERPTCVRAFNNPIYW